MDKYNSPPPYVSDASGISASAHFQMPSTGNSAPIIYPSIPSSSPQAQQTNDHPTVIIQTATTRQPVILGRESTYVTCPYCHADILTTVKHKATSRTHFWAVILCLFVCWPCVCLPYCMDSCQSANHYCPNCNTYIGAHDN